MADDTQLNPGTGGDVILTEDLGAAKVQVVKVAFGAHGSATDVAAGAPLPVAEQNSSTATRASVTNTADAPILAANANRVRAEFFNDADQSFLLGLSTAVTTSDFSVRLLPGASYAFDDYLGAVHGFFASTPGSGSLHVTELTP